MQNSTKKLLISVFVVLMVFTCALLCGKAGADLKLTDVIPTVSAQITQGPYTYEVEDGNATITAVDRWAVSGKVTVPSTLGGYPVTAIGYDAFTDCTLITEIIIPDQITTIGNAAFYGCSALKSINIPYGVTNIGFWMFQHCASLTAINIPDSVTSIASCAFSGCSSLKSVNIPKSVEWIGEYAFYGCSSLKSITIPNSVSTISYNAFYDCSSLESITMSNSVKLIEEGAFYGCTSLESITLPGTVTTIEYEAFKYSGIEDVYYASSKTQWNKIQIANGNEALTNAEIHYNSKSCVHSYSSKITKAATCTATGTRKYTCTKCSHSYTKTIAKTDHKYKDVITKATLNKNGKVVSKCSVCAKAKTTTVYYPKTTKLSKTAYTYNGKVQTPTVTVKDSKGNTLTKGTDYTVKLESGRTAPGRYTVTVTFKGKYSGTKNLTYTIAPKATKVSATQTTSSVTLTWNKVTGATGYRVYQYNATKKEWVAIKTLTANTLKVSNLKAGTIYKFKVKAYKNDNGTIWGAASAVFATATKTATPKITSLTTTKSKAVLKWSNVSGESGYEVYYSTKKDSGFTKISAYKADVLTATKTGLTSGKTYYFKVRAYKTVGDTKIYSAWSTVKSIKIK